MGKRKGNLRHDLVLEYKTGDREEQFVKLILANKAGQLYRFGSEYPGQRKGEEFLFSRVYERGVVNPTHCVIGVDEQGKYYIQNDTTYAKGRATRTSVYNTFVNSERVKGVEKRLLKTGDIISIGYPETRWVGPDPDHPRHPIYYVKEQMIQSYDSQVVKPKIKAGLKENAASPLDNDLIFSEIMSHYLPLSDLKTARLVCKKWKAEASRVLEKKCQVSFEFNSNYVNPQNSTRVARYLLEVKGLKIQNLHISLAPNQFRDWPVYSLVQSPLLFSPGQPGDKMLDDLGKLLKSKHNFSRLILKSSIDKESDFTAFALIFQKLGEKLIELKLQGDIFFLPEILPPFPLMSNLKKLDVTTHYVRLEGNDKKKWVSRFTPLFSNSLEHFTFEFDIYGNRWWFPLQNTSIEEAYLREFLKQGMPKLEGIATGVENAISEESLSLLLQLGKPLTSLKLYYVGLGEDCDMLEQLLWKNSKSLKHLSLKIGHEQSMEINFPPFPNLEELKLDYGSSTRINWGGKGIDYKKHFPSLRKLKILPEQGGNDAVLDSFFPQDDNGTRSETVQDLWVAVKRPPGLALNCRCHPAEDGDLGAQEEEEAYQPRMDKIREMFPNAVKTSFIKKCPGQQSTLGLCYVKFSTDTN